MRRWLVLIAVCAGVLFGLSGTTTVSAASFTYDTPAPTRVAVPSSVASGASPALLGELGRGSDLQTAEASGASTTPNLSVVATESEYVNLASESRTSHILDGEVRPNGTYGGGHRPGTGFPNKSEFPAGWSDDQIMHNISDVATDPALPWTPGDRPGDFLVNGTRSGVDIEVLIRNGQIWTGYPTNLPRNPR